MLTRLFQDRPLKEMTHGDWEATIQPKVHGTWNLHHALKNLPHDFFILFSSFSGIFGHWGQANYAAANTFLDAFTQYRHQQGLPASVLDIGAVDDVGYISQNAELQQHFRSTAVYPLHERELLDSLHLAILRSAPPPSSAVASSEGFRNPNQIGIGLRSTLPMSSPANRSIWKRDMRMALYRNLENADTIDTSGANEALKHFLSSVATDSALLNNASSVEFLAHEIGVTLFGFMLKPLDDLDVTAPLSALGVDSLISIELKNWCRQKLAIEISVLEILNVKNLAALGQVTVDGLKAKFGVTRSGEEFLQMKAP